MNRIVEILSGENLDAREMNGLDAKSFHDYEKDVIRKLVKKINNLAGL